MKNNVSTLGKVVVVMPHASGEIFEPGVRKSRESLITGGLYPSTVPCPPYLHCDSGELTGGLGNSLVIQSLSQVPLFATPWTAAMPGFPVLHQLLEFAQTHVHGIRDAIQSFPPLSSLFLLPWAAV